jgi:sugar/nucleoside kinase (ribokinase family)
MSVVWDILGIGVVAVDDLIYVDRYPLAGTKMPIQAQRREGGGLTGTALVAASRLGAKSAYGGVLGHDALSVFSIQELTREGVDCTPVLRRDQARPVHSLVVVDLSTAQRTILYTASGFTERQPDEITDELVANCRVLFVDHMAGVGGLRAVELARAHGVPVVGDIEREDWPRTWELVRQIDHLIVGCELAERVTGEVEPAAMARALSRDGRACCVVTAGERGSWYSERGGRVRHYPAFKVKVLDTTGCGDVFHGAYAACIAQERSVDDAVRVATAAAGIKATQPGGRAGIPDRAAVDRLLKENTITE